MSMDLQVDGTRVQVDMYRRLGIVNEKSVEMALTGDYDFPTGILVRALWEQRWVNADIYWLTLASLRTWLRSRGGDNPYAESVVEILLNHQDRT